MTSVYTIIFAAVLPAFLLVPYIWGKDKYDREPFSQIVKGVFYGVLSAGIAYFLEVGIQIFGLDFFSENGRGLLDVRNRTRCRSF